MGSGGVVVVRWGCGFGGQGSVPGREKAKEKLCKMEKSAKLSGEENGFFSVVAERDIFARANLSYEKKIRIQLQVWNIFVSSCS